MSLPVKTKARISGWGNYPEAQAALLRPERYSHLKLNSGGRLPRGFGKSYGDAAHSSKNPLLLMERLNRMRSFDEKQGILRAEAGISLNAILKTFVPRGWFLPVTPGTRFVSLGGCAACDVHGKNHHIDGSFGAHVKEMEVILPSGKVCRCSPECDPDLFWATVGGMGLTGIISEVSLRLQPIDTSYMIARHHPAQHLEAMIDILEDPGLDDRYSVAWIDCLSSGKHLGRGVVMTAHHAEAGEISTREKDLISVSLKAPRKLPYPFPFSILNRWSVKLFNAFYYRVQSRKASPFAVHYESYFYPLDAFANWNAIYGKKGFVQYQCVIPTINARAVLDRMMKKITASKRASFLAVLKKFGEEGNGMLSFPIKGYTLALDLPFSEKLLPFLETLDQEVVESGGRVYLAKDARLSPKNFRLMYPRFHEWLKVKRTVDPDYQFASDLSDRLLFAEGV